jgi:hypothetical protein
VPPVRAIVAILVGALMLVAAPAANAQFPGQVGDLLALGFGDGETPVAVPAQHNAEPQLLATPRAQCGPGAKREPGIQGRVPAGSATDGLTCNTELVSHQGKSGGFKAWRYVDTNGHTCAFYDTALLFPINAFKLDASSLGVAVLDMTDPAHPVQTDTLTAPPMLTPHESLVLNAKRGLLAASLGNPDNEPGDVAIYDVHGDCRHPVKTFEAPIARYGHESGFSPDGRTLYITSGSQTITAIDVSDPKNARDLWQGNEPSHGMSLSDDGNRAYLANIPDATLTIVDTSDIQARKPDPHVREVSRLTWKGVSIPQNAMPFTRDGHPYILEFDEYSSGLSTTGSVGAARIIDIADERRPFVVSNLRLQIDQQPDRANASGDPGMSSPVQGYAAHYCSLPSRVDPTLVACSFIASGLRVFDISDLAHPKEAAYFVAPTQAAAENGYNASDFAMSQPAFDTARHDVWFTDGPSGFYVVHLTNGAWPAAAASAGHTCRSRRAFPVTVRAPRGAKIRRATATLAGRRIAVSVKGRSAHALARLTGLPRRAVRLVLRVTLTNHRTVVSRRTYHPCTARRHA